jgi:hypothetical protein
MHHEKETSEEIERAMRLEKEELHFGPTGQFPEGKLTSNDEGQIAFGVAIYHGKVIVNFGTPIASLGLSPQEARQLALVLRQRANEIERNPGS